MWMIRPAPCARMCGNAARLARMAGHRFTSSVAAQSSSVASPNVRPPVDPPTLFTSTSSRPSASTVCSTARADAASSAISSSNPVAFTPTASISPTVCSSRSLPRAVIATLQPSAASATAIDRPIPRLPPVTNAALPLSPRSMRALPQSLLAVGIQRRGLGFASQASRSSSDSVLITSSARSQALRAVSTP